MCKNGHFWTKRQHFSELFFAHQTQKWTKNPKKWLKTGLDHYLRHKTHSKWDNCQLSRKISKNVQVPENNFFLFLENDTKRPEKWSKKLKKIFPHYPIPWSEVKINQVHKKNFFFSKSHETSRKVEFKIKS